jgi:hypothetical protein
MRTSCLGLDALDFKVAHVRVNFVVRMVRIVYVVFVSGMNFGWLLG